tara:strand:+ start:1516 stop:1887 length:372 start_codon:yes stop_codon:yes gene_type:complete
MNKLNGSYKTIGEVVKILGLQSRKGQSLPTHTIRFWEKSFKQIRPKILKGNRRYYDNQNIELIKKVYFLLKVKGMTIKGVKNFLDNKETLNLDEKSHNPIKDTLIKNKIVKISNLIKNLKTDN